MPGRPVVIATVAKENVCIDRAQAPDYRAPMSPHRLSRRDLLWLLSGGAASLAVSCIVSSPSSPTPEAVSVSSPVLQPATAVPTADPPTPTAQPTLAPTVAATATPIPTATTVPTATPIPTLERAIARGALPSGSVLIRYQGAEWLRSAYGNSFAFASKTKRSAEPIAATPDTLYDYASLTKLFTATCVMRLVEQGRVALDEPVARYVPVFGSAGKDRITVRQLLTHTGGLPAFIPVWQREGTPEDRLRVALEVKPTDPPGSVFRYSDMGFIALGRLVDEVSGLPLDRAVRTWITEPLGLGSIGFLPSPELKPRIAATEDAAEPPRGLVWGEVHDPNAWSLGGVAGHAGVFGTARDLATFGQVFLDGGGALLRTETVEEMTRLQIGKPDARGLGWEIDESFYMGRLASPGTYGHTGFTGTSLVIAPRYDLVVVLLTNRVHPSVDGPNMNSTRQAVSDAALAAVQAA
jgi:serine-type D-Ala-D-Ala carboxypeptidase